MIKIIMNKLRTWLFKDELKQFEEAKNTYERLNGRLSESIMEFAMAKEAYSDAQKLATDSHKLVNSLMDVGVDIELYSNDYSWAVVCIKGRPEYVKFIPLNHKDARDIMIFLKHFEYSNRVVDSPFAFRNMVDHCIMENPFFEK